MPGLQSWLARPLRIWRALVLIIAATIAFCFFGVPLHHDGGNGETLVHTHHIQQMCKDYPDDGHIAISIKTGATEAMKKLPAILDTSLACVKDVMIFSDLNQTFRGHVIHDALSRISKDTIAGNKDFGLYWEQQKAQSRNQEDEIERLFAQRPAHVFDWRTEGHTAGWALDKYKFLHMLEMAYELQPDRDWYLFVETDTYLSWPNLKRWLRTLDPTAKLYIGNAIQKSDDRSPLYFAHGGSGFLLSRAALKEFAVDRKGIANRFDPRMHQWWAGDFTVADVLYDEMGLEVKTAAPMFTQHHPLTFPFNESSWCEPVLTLHHILPEDFRKISNDEGALTKSRMLFRDIYFSTYNDTFPEKRSDWDNVADAKEFALIGDGEECPDFESCRLECEHMEDCFQFTWRNTTEFLVNEYVSKHSCVLSSAFRLGYEKTPQQFWANLDERNTYRAWHSGWLADRIASWVDAHRECPEDDHWTTDGESAAV